VLHALGRLVASRARWFLLGWLVAVVLSFAAAGGGLGGQSLFERLEAGDSPQVPGESRTGNDLLRKASPTGTSVQLLLDRVDPASPAVRSAVLDVQDRLDDVPQVRSVVSPFPPASPPGAAADPAAVAGAAAAARGAVSADGRAVLVSVQLAPDLPRPQEREAVARVTALLEAVPAQVPGSTGSVGGLSALIDEINTQVNEDLRTGEQIALPLSLLVMVVVFGGFLAAGLPIVGAIASSAGALVSLLGFSYLIGLDSSVVSVVSVLGLGLSIDYGLLLVSRYREELRASARGDAGADPRADRVAALERTMASAGRTVVFSAVTVAISLSGLMLFEASLLRAVGAAGVSVVLVALLVALTLVPALMVVSGDRLIRPGLPLRIPGVRRFGDVAPEEGAFSQLARRVQRRPVVVIVAVLLVLGLAAVPALQMRLTSSGQALLPVTSPSRIHFDAVQDRFPALAQAPIVVVTRASAQELSRWAPTVRALPGVASVDPVTEQGRGADRVALLRVRTTAAHDSDEARAVVSRIRDVRPAFEVYVSGRTAQVADFVDRLGARAPSAIGVVVLATFVLLFLMTGSVLVPLKALLMNVVSLGASFGVLVWVFQQGNLESLLGFTSTGGIETAIPPLVLAFGFGLAMDYEVFLLSRIKEARDAGAGNDESVVVGLQRSGRIISSAAVIIVLVFSGFVAGQLLVIKQTGVSLAVAIAVDATLIRMLLVPATMTLLGDWNWWAPGPLRRLHARFGLSEGPSVATPVAAAVDAGR